MKGNLVVIATYHYSRALLLKGRLESEGIECYLNNVDPGQIETSSGVKVLIQEDDVAAATRIIKSISKEYGETDLPSKPVLFKIHRILIPVDFSEQSLIACDYASELASRLNAEMRIMHSYYDPPSVASAFPDTFSYELSMGGLTKDLENMAREEMKAFKEKVIERGRLKGMFDLKVNTLLVQGNAEEEIRRISKKYKPNLIVIANKGKDKTDKNPLGHVTADLIDKSEFPVFTIPEKAGFHNFNNNRLLYLTDFDDPDFTAFRKLISIVSPYNMKVFCIHIGETDNVYDRVQMEELQDKIMMEYPGFDVACHLLSDKDIVKGVNTFIAENKIDLLAMTNRKRSFIYRILSESNARKMLYSIPVPMLVFKINS
jgi:nucleotide-binding universal stress UspA family protein